MSQRTPYYPEHDRDSCSDASPVNAEAGGSHGCARCTAILLDQRDEFLAVLQDLADFVDPLTSAERLCELGSKYSDTDDEFAADTKAVRRNLIAMARAAIAKAGGAR